MKERHINPIFRQPGHKPAAETAYADLTEQERNFADNWIGILENDGLLPAGSTKAPKARDAFAREIRCGMEKGMFIKHSRMHKANT